MARGQLAVFDIDGTLARIPDDDVIPDDIFDEDRVGAMVPVPNMIEVARQYVDKPNVEIVFCTGRPKRIFGVTWRWLNRHLGLARSGKRVTLVCRPPNVPPERIPVFKLAEVVQAIRRMGGKPDVAIFDDDVLNLRMFETLQSRTADLRLFRVEDGVVSKWSL